MSTEHPHLSSPRRAELLDACYRHALEHGLAAMSLRPLAAATGTSPRVLLYLFGSKDELVRAVLARARHDQVAHMTALLDRSAPAGSDPFEHAVGRLWEWLAAPEQRPFVRLTYEAFHQSLGHDPGPWRGFAAETSQEWQRFLIDTQPDVPPDTARARAIAAMGRIRGLLLELLAGTDPACVWAAWALDGGR